MTWAGVESINGCCGAQTFNNVSAAVTTPQFMATCTSNLQENTYGSWVAFGADPTQALWQAGTYFQASDTLTTPYHAFYEGINASGSVDTGITQFPMTVGTSALVYSSVGWDGANLWARVYNATTGVSKSVALTSYKGNPASIFYNGSAADFINERLLMGGVPTKLNRPAPGYQTWTDAYVTTITSGGTWLPAGLTSFAYQDMTTNGHHLPGRGSSPNDGVELMALDNGLSNQTTWSNIWHRCS